MGDLKNSFTKFKNLKINGFYGDILINRTGKVLQKAMPAKLKLHAAIFSKRQMDGNG
jgi:hypothetical protein